MPNRIIGNLSKGFRQRVGLAQALLNDPGVLILDEPTIGLDPSQIIEIRRLIQDLREDRTILLSSHILPEVAQLCQRVIIINKGEIVATDSPANLTSQLQKTAKIVLEVSGPSQALAQAIENMAGVEKVSVRKQRDQQVCDRDRPVHGHAPADRRHGGGEGMRPA